MAIMCCSRRCPANKRLKTRMEVVRAVARGEVEGVGEEVEGGGFAGGAGMGMAGRGEESG